MLRGRATFKDSTNHTRRRCIKHPAHHRERRGWRPALCIFSGYGRDAWLTVLLGDHTQRLVWEISPPSPIRVVWLLFTVFSILSAASICLFPLLHPLFLSSTFSRSWSSSSAHLDSSLTFYFPSLSPVFPSFSAKKKMSPSLLLVSVCSSFPEHRRLLPYFVLQAKHNVWSHIRLWHRVLGKHRIMYSLLYTKYRTTIVYKEPVNIYGYSDSKWSPSCCCSQFVLPSCRLYRRVITDFKLRSWYSTWEHVVFRTRCAE